jgi:hypothetical protein
VTSKGKKKRLAKDAKKVEATAAVGAGSVITGGHDAFSKAIDTQLEARTPITDIPPDLARSLDPPKDLEHKLANSNEFAPCHQQVTTLTWKKGPHKGQPLQLFCAEPLCLETGRCTGPRFVPSPQQWTSDDPNSLLRRPRKLDVEEIVTGVEAAGRAAAQKTGVRDSRSQQQIARHVGETWRKMKDSVSGPGKWGMGGS